MVAKGRSTIGDRNGSRLHPEKLKRGQYHPSKTRPECLLRGEDHPLSKLSEQDVFDIHARRSSGERAVLIAKDKGVSRHTVDCIFKGKYWPHVFNKINNGLFPGKK